MHECYMLPHIYWITITHGRSRPCSTHTQEWVDHQYAWIILYYIHKFKPFITCEVQWLNIRSEHAFRSIRCTSQNTETVIQTFRQPTAAFISE